MSAALATLAALFDETALDVELVRRGGLRKFIELAWPIVEPAPFVGGWHIDAIADHLMAVQRGEIDRLVINVPPGCSKSKLTSVLWPAWVWTFEPSHKWMTATFDAALARRDALSMRALIKSDWYQRRWATRINDSPDVQETMGIYHTTAGGFRYSTTVGGGATGWHCHTQIVDDPTKPADIAGEPEAARLALERDWDWWRSTMASRKADPSKFRRVVIMQRLHEDDLASRCIDEGYTVLMLPMRFEAARKCVTKWGGDQRTVEGELLCPARFDEKTVADTERDMGSQTAAAQLQQRPAPAKGLIFERKWLAKEWHELPVHPRWIQSWDCAFKDLSTSDYVVGQTWCQKGAEFYLVHQVRARMSFSETCQAIRDMTKLYPMTTAKLIEDKANGTAVIDTLTKEIPGLVAVEPDGGKIARAHAASPCFEAGNVWVPPLDKAPWVAAWREEMATFPMGRFDDSVDATTQAVNWMRLNGAGMPDQIKSEDTSRYSRRVGL